jgi:hypothetical protein
VQKEQEKQRSEKDIPSCSARREVSLRPAGRPKTVTVRKESVFRDKSLFES